MTPVEHLAEVLANVQGQGAAFREERATIEVRRKRAEGALAEPPTGGYLEGYTEQANAIVYALGERGIDLVAAPPIASINFTALMAQRTAEFERRERALQAAAAMLGDPGPELEESVRHAQRLLEDAL